MAHVKRVIELSEEEKKALVKVKEILKDISLDLDNENPVDFINGEYITDILDIPFEY